jgi:hypothetical protein
MVTLNGAVTFGSGSSVEVDLGGTGAGQFGQVQVTGAATLGGTLNLNLVNGYTPVSGDAIQIATYGSETGQFATVNGTALPGGLVWALAYNTANLTITAGMAQMAEMSTGPVPAASSGVALGDTLPGVVLPQELTNLENAAIARWAAAGLAPA